MAAKDNFPKSVAYPHTALAALTNPNPGAFVDATDLPFKPRAIHVSVAGNVKYVANGVTITEAFEVGWHPIRPDQIFSTGTTATLVAWE